MRAIDHVSITVRDLAKAVRFYDAVFEVLRLKKVYQRADAVGYGERNRPDDDGHSYLSIFQSEHASADPRRHWCFRAASAADVRRFHAAGLASGGRDAGGPGLRTHYHPQYFAAFLEDPEGNRIEAACHHGDEP
ncbi:MAG TPA: VOC family protein [Burkholderiales bacterium]|nr:VOC family protein [Burkholderiales bacterium]